MQTASQPRNWTFFHRVLLVLVVLTCLRVWVGPPESFPVARAQIPDSGLQRKQLLEEARRTNQILAEIKQILLTHTLHVQFPGADKTGTDNKRGMGERRRPKRR